MDTRTTKNKKKYIYISKRLNYRIDDKNNKSGLITGEENMKVSRVTGRR